MISVELTQRFKKIVREAWREAEVSAPLKLGVEGSGNPNAHTGLAIRNLKTLVVARLTLTIFAAEVWSV